MLGLRSRSRCSWGSSGAAGAAGAARVGVGWGCLHRESVAGGATGAQELSLEGRGSGLDWASSLLYQMSSPGLGEWACGMGPHFRSPRDTVHRREEMLTERTN